MGNSERSLPVNQTLAHETRDAVVDDVQHRNERTELPAKQILRWMKMPEGTFYNWQQRYGKVNQHNGWIPREHWLEDEIKKAILEFHLEHRWPDIPRLNLAAEIGATASN